KFRSWLMNDQAIGHKWLPGATGQFALTGPLRRPGGEHDLNFRGPTADGDIIVKAMRPHADASLVERQCAGIAFARAADPGLPLPQILPFPDGRLWQVVDDDRGQSRLVWVQRALPGIAMGELGPQSPILLSQLGE